MKTQIIPASIAVALGVLLAASAVAQTASAPPPSAPAQRSETVLEKLVAPIALYPDPLLAVVLPAAAYPVEIVQAARFVKDTNNIPKLDEQPWDENVKAVARFPAVISKMDAELNWTTDLGQAFIDQPKELMDAIQSLRAKAQTAGTLQTTPQQIVYVTNNIIEIQPADPQVIYVPTYTTTVYYPPPGYVYNPYAPLITFGAGLAMGIIIANNCDWHGGCVWYGGGYYHHGDVDIDIDHNYNVNRPDRPDRPAQRPGDRPRPTQKWQPDQSRLRASATPATAQSREARGWGGATTQPAQRPSSPGAATQPVQRPGAASPGQQPSYDWTQKPAAGTQPARTPGAGQQPAPTQRPATPTASTRPTTTWQQPAANRPAPAPAATARPAQTPSYTRPAAQPSSAFSGVNSGGNARAFSNRGASSRGGGRGRR